MCVLTYGIICLAASDHFSVLPSQIIFIFPCTNNFHRRSLYTFYQADFIRLSQLINCYQGIVSNNSFCFTNWFLFNNMGLPSDRVIMHSMWSLTIEAVFFMKYFFHQKHYIGRNAGDMGQPKCTMCHSIYGIKHFIRYRIDWITNRIFCSNPVLKIVWKMRLFTQPLALDAMIYIEIEYICDKNKFLLDIDIWRFD